MSVTSAAPASARAVYTALIVLGAISVIIVCVAIGVISYKYVTSDELRNPVEETGGGH